MDLWIKDLITKAGNCEFRDLKDRMIQDKLVFGVSDERVKERLLRESDLTLKKAVNVIHAPEKRSISRSVKCHQVLGLYRSVRCDKAVGQGPFYPVLAVG